MLIVRKVCLLVAILITLSTGWGLCKLANEERDKGSNGDKDKKGTLGLGMLICFVAAGFMVYQMVTI